MRPSKGLLDGINWDFPTSLPGVGTSLHWYPGTFPNALPTTLIEAFTNPDDLVFDPYSGIGTTGFEATRQGRRALLTDSNPIAVAVSLFSCALVSAQRWSPLYLAGVLNEIAAVVDAQERGRQSLISLPAFTDASGKGAGVLRQLEAQAKATLSDCVLPDPAVRELSPWFHSKTLKDILSLREVLLGEDMSPLARLGGFVMLSAVLRASSSQTASWGHVADNVLPKELTQKSVHLQCRGWLGRTARVMREIDSRPVVATEADTPQIKRVCWPDPPPKALEKWQAQAALMVTSPPYASAIDYTLSQRLSHYLFGYTDDVVMAFVAGEIGARRRRFHPAPEEIWAVQLAHSLEAQLDIMKSNGVVCVVLPHKESGRLLGSAAVETVLSGRDWRKFWVGSRSIRQSRTRQSWTSIQKETLMVYVGRDY